MWWATTPGGDRPVLVLTRDPVADRIGAVVVAACTRTVRGLMSELPLGPEDGMPAELRTNAGGLLELEPRDDHARAGRHCKLGSSAQ